MNWAQGWGCGFVLKFYPHSHLLYSSTTSDISDLNIDHAYTRIIKAVTDSIKKTMKKIMFNNEYN